MSTLSEPSLQSYLRDMSHHSVPTHEEEVESFRRLADVEARMIRAFLKRPGAEDGLRKAALTEERPLPPKLFDGRELKAEVTSLVRLTDSGRDWFQEHLLRPTKGEGVRAMAAEREAIKNAFVAANLRLTVSLAKKYAKFCKHQSLGDIVQEGNIGLMKAVDRFDLDRGYRFATYATWWIRHHIKRSVADKETPIRIPVHVADLSAKLNRMDGNYMAETGESMSPDQMAKAAKVPLEKVLNVLASRTRMAYLDSPVGEEENVALVDTVESHAFPDPLTQLFSERVRIELLDLLSGLTPTESRIIRYRFGIGPSESELTLQEIADQYDLSRERIRQIEAKAIEKLKRRMGNRSMREYLLEAG